MPIPIEKLQAVEDEIQREHETKVKTDDDDDDDDVHENHHTTAMTPPDQDFSFLKNHLQTKRSVRYDIEQIDEHEHRPLRASQDTEPSVDNVLRRRYIAHWGLPGSLTFISSKYIYIYIQSLI